MHTEKIAVLLCDDSALIRVTLKRIIEKDPQVYVAGVARNGEEAVAAARRLKPGVILLDVEMPRMDGLSALKIINAEDLAPVIMFSTLTVKGAHTTLEALENGAFDFISKPEGTENIARLAEEILQKIKSAAQSRPQKKEPARTLSAAKTVPMSEITPYRTVTRPAAVPSGLPFKAVVIGISTGGPRTIFDVLPLLPAELPAAIILVQHMPPTFTSAFAQRINNRTKMPCLEADAGMPLEKGKIYVARGGFHCKLLRKSNQEILLRLATEPRHMFMPSVDVTMESVVEQFKGDTVGVLMTGMGWDGAASMVRINEQGGVTIAESRESAVVFGMPQEAMKRSCVQVVAPSTGIAAEIIRAVNGKGNAR